MRAITVTLILDCADEEVPDAVNGLLRELQRGFNPHSCLIDYSLAVTSVHVSADPVTYEEGEAFR